LLDRKLWLAQTSAFELPVYNLPQVRVYVHAPGAKELYEVFDEIQPITLHQDVRSHSLNIIRVEKRTRVATSKEPCINREAYSDYDPAMVRAIWEGQIRTEPIP
jgi:hypothetical protein